MDSKKDILILGAGLAGLSTAYHLNGVLDYAIFEKEEETGGLARSVCLNGFTFDCDGHLLHFRNNYTLELITRLLNGNLASHKRNSWIFSKGTYTRYPFQANSYGLPKEIVKECLMGLIRARLSETPKNNDANFEDWVYKTFGEGIAKHFMIPYNRKFWTVEPKELTCEWLDGFVPVPSLEDVISGAISDYTKSFGYNAQFWYPIRGGISELSKSFLKNVRNLYLKKEVSKIDIKNKVVEFTDKSRIGYKILINTLPLPELPRLIEDLSEEIREDFNKLKWTSIFVLNLGIERERISDKHWIYFPGEDFIFYRVGFPMNFSSLLTPEGCSSLYAEVSYSAQKTLEKEGLEERIIGDLKRARILQEGDRIIVKCPVEIKYAYILYDQNYSNSTSQLINFLRDFSIYSLGRYGSWRYMSMEDVILQGKEHVSRYFN